MNAYSFLSKYNVFLEKTKNIYGGAPETEQMRDKSRLNADK